MNKLMCRFVATTKKKKKIPDPNLDTACPAGIPCKNIFTIYIFIISSVCVYVLGGG